MVIDYPESRCRQCNGALTFCQLTDSNGNKHIRIWCVPCYRLFSKSVTRDMREQYLVLDRDILPVYLTKSQRGIGILAGKLDKPKKKALTVAQLKALPYSEYLETSHWKKLRGRAIRAAMGRCQLCNSPDRLNTHHRTYKRLGCELLSDLTVLCRDCHARFHDKLP